MSEDVTGPKSGWNASDGTTSNSINQPDRTKGTLGSSHQTGNSTLIDPVTGINRLSLSSTASPSATFASTSRQR